MTRTVASLTAAAVLYAFTGALAQAPDAAPAAAPVAPAPQVTAPAAAPAPAVEAPKGEGEKAKHGKNGKHKKDGEHKKGGKHKDREKNGDKHEEGARVTLSLSASRPFRHLRACPCRRASLCASHPSYARHLSGAFRSCHASPSLPRP